MSAMAVSTKKIKLGPGISNPYTRHPSMIASTMSTLDEAAPGRAMIGLGAGGSMTLRPTGFWPHYKPIAAMREAVEVIRRLLAGETVDYDGKVIKCVKARILPPKAEIPIIMAARRPQMFRLLGEIADGALIPRLHSWSIKYIEEGAKRAGRTLDDIDLGHAVGMKIVKSEEEKDKAREHGRHSLPFRIADSPPEQFEGIVTKEEREAVIEAVKRGGIPEAKPLITDEMIDKTTAIGTPDEVLEIVEKRLVERADFYWVSMPPGPDMDYAFKALKEKIFPALDASF
jgi:5,10-methylenetetrahydromethanopterin reductase